MLKPGKNLFRGLHACKVASVVFEFVTVWTVAHQAPLSMGFSRQEYWHGLPFPSPGDLPNPETKSMSPELQVDSLPLSHQGNPLLWGYVDEWYDKVLGKKLKWERGVLPYEISMKSWEFWWRDGKRRNQVWPWISLETKRTRKNYIRNLGIDIEDCKSLMRTSTIKQQCRPNLLWDLGTVVEPVNLDLWFS